jgi:hypothetical protein
MIDVEALLSAANPLPESGPGSQVEVPTFESVWAATRKTDDGQGRFAREALPTNRPRRVRALVGSAGGLVTAGLVVVLLLLSSGPAPAYAGWTAIPAAASQGRVTAALQTCGASSIAGDDGRSLPAPVLSETRGRYVAVVSIRHGRAIACVTNGPGDSSESTFAEFPRPAAGLIGGPSVYGTSAPSFPGSKSEPPSAFAKRQINGLCEGRPKGCADRLRRTARAHVTVAFGRAGAGVTRVAFDMPRHSTVKATVEHGWYFAWWPWTGSPSSARVTNHSGTTSVRIR